MKQTRFASAEELEATLQDYVGLYNHHIPQRALGHLSPVQALLKWQTSHPELFVGNVNNQPVPNIYDYLNLDEKVIRSILTKKMYLKLQDYVFAVCDQLN